MKRFLLSLTMLFVVSMMMCAQTEVTKFLGIPVDGSKSEMMRKLKKKGFTASEISKELLQGEFNGREVYVGVATNNDKVYRIFLSDIGRAGEAEIKIRFNTLCQQFMDNDKYLSVSDCIIPAEEDIEYEMTVNDKRYEAIFYQKQMKTDSIAAIERMRSKLLEKYTQEQLDNPTEEIQKDIIQTTSYCYADLVIMRPVWFMIGRDDWGEYYIAMYYDNEYNRAKGEDL